jgi:hypothetical protein
MQKIARKLYKAYFYRIYRPLKVFFTPKKKFALHEYKNEKGEFDYELYKKIQQAGNIKKIDRSWAIEEDVVFLSKYIKQQSLRPTFGLCQGTRRGLEQKWFAKNLNCKVIGTEISDTASQFPDTVQWDFHEDNPDWIGKADFVYSNSFDHSYDPKKSLSAWMRSLKPDGICIIQHSQEHTPETVNELDPFGAALEIMPYLILTWSEGQYSVREIIASKYPRKDSITYFIIIKNNNSL